MRKNKTKFEQRNVAAGTIASMGYTIADAVKKEQEKKNKKAAAAAAADQMKDMKSTNPFSGVEVPVNKK
jgi:hypothetical protein